MEIKERQFELETLIIKALRQRGTNFRLPARRRSRGKRVRVQVPHELLGCSCLPPTPTPVPFGDSVPPDPTETVIVWAKGSKHGQCQHERCGRVLLGAHEAEEVGR